MKALSDVKGEQQGRHATKGEKEHHLQASTGKKGNQNRARECCGHR